MPADTCSPAAVYGYAELKYRSLSRQYGDIVRTFGAVEGVGQTLHRFKGYRSPGPNFKRIAGKDMHGAALLEDRYRETVLPVR